MNETFEEKITFEVSAEVPSVQDEHFYVPSGLSHLTLQHDPDAASGLPFPVFLMVKDPAGKTRFLKQLGYSEPVIRIGAGAPDTTIGGVPGPVGEGLWTLKIFLFTEYLSKIPAQADPTFTVAISDRDEPVKEVIGGKVWTDTDLIYSNYNFKKVYKPDAGWYMGDLHTHTRLSDGQETPQNASRKAVMMEMDYYVPTEHNVMHTGWPKTEVMIVPGIEITSPIGHMNLIGIDRKMRSLEDVLADSDECRLIRDYEDIISECKNKGWLVSINHPYLHLRKWLYRDFCLMDADCIEIINDPTYAADPDAGTEEANKKAVYLADLLWEDGYRICAVGGSDSHRLIDDPYPGAAEPSVPGDPATWLYMDCLSPAALKKALYSCSCYVSRHCSLRTELRFGTQLPETQEWLHYEIHLRGYRKKPDLFYRHNGMEISCAGLTKEDHGWCVRGSIYLNRTVRYHCIRFGGREENGTFLFYANPITRGRRAHRFITFGDVTDYLEETYGIDSIRTCL